MNGLSTSSSDETVAAAIASLCTASSDDPRRPLDDPDRLASLQAVMSRSPWWCEAALRHTEWLIDWLASAAPESDPDRTPEPGRTATALERHRRALESAGAAVDASDDTARLEAVLRRHRERSMLEILWHELLARVPVEHTFTALTALADASITAAFDAAHRATAARVGEPWRDAADTGAASRDADTPGRLLVIGMGKLGGGELNVSSDIDLIYLYPDGGSTRGAARSIDNHEFYQRVARLATRLLSTRTAQGFVFRVDTRLRPFGESGPLAMSLDGFEHYLLTQGRTWERYAMVKARVIFGRPVDVERFESLRRPFVFRRYLDYSAIEALRELKQQIAASVRRRRLIDDIKLGAGGIREVEFLVQVRQLIRGGQEPRLQCRALLPTLDALVDLGQLERDEAEALANDYRLLRRTENLIQALHDRQEHALPTDPADRARIVAAMGRVDWADFRQALDAARFRIAERFDRLFDEAGNDRRHRTGTGSAAGASAAHAPGAETTVEPSSDAVVHGGAAPVDPVARERSALAERWAEALSPQLSTDERDAARRERGLPDVDGLETAIEQLLVGPRFERLTARGQQRVERALPLALACLPSTGRGDALAGFVGFARAVAGRSGYLQILIERPPALERLLRLFAASRWLVDFVTRHPIVIDELVAPTRSEAPISRDTFLVETRRQRDRVVNADLEEQMDAFRRLRQSMTLRIAVAALDGELPVMQVSDRLSWLAEAVIDAVLTLVRSRLAERHGEIRTRRDDDDGSASARDEPAPVVDVGVVAYGKLGGLELGFGSDLDLVFVHGDTPVGMTDGAKPIEGDRFFARLAQRFVSFMTTRTTAGVLYPIDLRLRPNGSSGVLVTGFTSFADYQRERAWTWEHQALVRARLVVGDTATRRAFDATRDEVLTRARDRDSLRSAVADMRRRMREHLSRGDADMFHLKHDAGGTIDIEFIVQYLVLAHASDHAGLVRYTDNIRILEVLADTDVLSTDCVATLSKSYLALREYLHRRALQLQDESVPLDASLVRLRHDVSACWDRVVGEASDSSGQPTGPAHPESS